MAASMVKAVTRSLPWAINTSKLSRFTNKKVGICKFLGDTEVRPGQFEVDAIIVDEIKSVGLLAEPLNDVRIREFYNTRFLYHADNSPDLICFDWVRAMMNVDMGAPIEENTDCVGEICIFGTDVGTDVPDDEDSGSVASFAPSASALDISYTSDAGSLFGFGTVDLPEWLPMEWGSWFSIDGLCLGRGKFEEDSGFLVLPTPYAQSPWHFGIALFGRSVMALGNARKSWSDGMKDRAVELMHEEKMIPLAMLLTAKPQRKYGMQALGIFCGAMRRLRASDRSSCSQAPPSSPGPSQLTTGSIELRTRSRTKDPLRAAVSAELKRRGRNAREAVCKNLNISFTKVSALALDDLEQMAAELGIGAAQPWSQRACS